MFGLNYLLSKLYSTYTKYLKPHVQGKLEVKRPSLNKSNKANFASVIAQLYFHRLTTNETDELNLVSVLYYSFFLTTLIPG